MIRNFADKETKKIFSQQFSKRLPQAIQKATLRKLIMLDNATNINDLRVPPANHLEQLVGDREGQYSIKINAQYRLCFSVENQNDFINVEVVGYHH
ncbi:type II toxin-antitoxin system RelE/ParE family toxin [Ligilactobacillus acidipiscis]|jgi:proteic killer suppression protein|uniref:type II toxin-antitoxin system RelE/ParE family toxin n=1 Tax=Ligilactobacillus acidipiscis TaxID=89059 RepID=UPI002FDAE9EA